MSSKPPAVEGFACASVVAGSTEPIKEGALEAPPRLLHAVEGLEDKAELGPAVPVESVGVAGGLMHERDLAVLENSWDGGVVRARRGWRRRTGISLMYSGPAQSLGVRGSSKQ